MPPRSTRIQTYFKKCQEMYSRAFMESIEQAENPTPQIKKKKEEKISFFYRYVLPSLLSNYFDPETGNAYEEEENQSGFTCVFHECFEIPLKFGTRQSLVRHLITFHYELIPGGGLFLLTNPESHNRFVCSSCSQMSRSNNEFINHLAMCKSKILNYNQLLSIDEGIEVSPIVETLNKERNQRNNQDIQNRPIVDAQNKDLGSKITVFSSIRENQIVKRKDENAPGTSITLVKPEPPCLKEHILLMSGTDVTANPRLKACLHFGASNGFSEKTTPILESIKHNENFHKAVTERKTSTPNSLCNSDSEIPSNQMIKSISNISLKKYNDQFESSSESPEEEYVTPKMKRERSNGSIVSLSSKQQYKKTKKEYLENLKEKEKIGLFPLIILTSESDSSDRELLEYLEF